MRGPNLPLGEWFRVLPLDVSGCPVSPVHILQYLSFLCTWGKRWCAPPVVMCMLMADDSIYQGLSRVGNLRTIIHMEEVSLFATLDQWPNLPNGEEANSQHEPSCDDIIFVSGAWRVYLEDERVGVRWRVIVTWSKVLREVDEVWLVVNIVGQ